MKTTHSCLLVQLVLISVLKVSKVRAAHEIFIPPFQILACLPEREAPQVSLELRRVISEWETSADIIYSSFNLIGPKGDKLRPSDIPLFVSPVPVGNDTSEVIPALCDALEIHNPSIVLSFLDKKKSFFARTVSACGWVPILSFTREYKENPTTVQASITELLYTRYNALARQLCS